MARRKLRWVAAIGAFLAAWVAVDRMVKARRELETLPGTEPEWAPLSPIDAAVSDDLGPDEAAEGWVSPDEAGACPLSHPIKGKVVSGIYHQPGGLSYDRTRADRCYLSADAAEVDGLRPAKR